MGAANEFVAINLWGVGATFGWVRSVNDLGQVVGIIDLSPQESHAAVWSPAEGLKDLGTLGGPRSFAEDINNTGTVAGSSFTANGELHAVIWRDGAITDLGYQGSAVAINDLGQVVGRGVGSDFKTHTFLWENGELLDLNQYLGREWSYPSDINDLGQVVGGVEGSIFLWTPGGGVRFIGDASSSAQSINNRGEIVGQSMTAAGELRAVLWSQDGAIHDLGALGGGWSIAYDINDLGQVVGMTSVPDGFGQAFLWSADGGMLNLGSFRPEGDYFTNAIGSYAKSLNDRGDIVGSFLDSPASFGRPVMWQVSAPELNPGEALTRLESSVTNMLNTGRLDLGHARALQATLKASSGALDRGNPVGTVNLLNAFIHQVTAFEAGGFLAANDAHTLIELAQDIIARLSE